MTSRPLVQKTFRDPGGAAGSSAAAAVDSGVVRPVDGQPGSSREPCREGLWSHPSDRALGLALVCVHMALLAWSATHQSPTLNEPGHLAAGIVHWRYARFEPYCVNPPLVRMAAAAPVLAGEFEIDVSRYSSAAGARPEFPLGTDFIRANGSRSQELFVRARWACVPFSLLGLITAGLWAHALHGRGAARLAMLLWCFEPNLLAHGQLLTPDAAANALGLAAGYTFWRWLQAPTVLRSCLAGCALGAALLSKLTWAVLPVLWPLLWLAHRVSGARHPARGSGGIAEMLQLLLVLMLGLHFLNCGYAYVGVGTRLGDFEFISARLSGHAEPGAPSNRFAGHGIGSLRLPIPADYVRGLDVQWVDHERYPWPSYVRGTWSEQGWWWYYLYAAAVKIPLGVWLLAGLAAVVRFRCGRPESRTASTLDVAWGEIVLLGPSLLVGVLVSSQTEFTHHLRYVLPCLGPMLVFAAGAVRCAFRPARWAVGLFAGWAVLSSLMQLPRSLGYFNELAGGPLRGDAHLLHSNLDWGQDLVALKDWMDRRADARPMFVACQTMFDPSDWGLDSRIAPFGPVWGTQPPENRFVPGWYAVSVSFVRGDRWMLSRPGAYAGFRELTPEAVCGSSIRVYRVDEAQAAKLNADLK